MANEINTDQINNSFGQTTEKLSDLIKVLESHSHSVKSVTDLNIKAKQQYQKSLKEMEEFIKQDRLFNKQTKLNTEALRKAAIQQLDAIEQEKKQDAERQRILESEKKRDSQRERAVRSLVSGFSGLVSANTGATTAIYSSNKAFTAVIPTLDLVSNAFKATIDALGEASAGIPVIGGVGKGLSKLAVAAVDVATNIAKMQLEMAQGYQDEYNKLSAVGVTFGGNLTGLAEAAKTGGLNLQSYSSFVTDNIESLSKMGGNMETAALRVMKMGKAATEGNDRLLVMYGGFEQVDAVLADFSGLMASAGANSVKNQKGLEEASGSYLYTLKELSSITGKNAKQLKADQEELLKDVAFKQKINELQAQGPEGMKKATALMSQAIMVQDQYGKQAGDLFKEKVANDGQVISISGNIYRSQFAAQEKAIDGFRANADLDEKIRNAANMATIQANEAEAEQQRKNFKVITQVGQYAEGASNVTKQLRDGQSEEITTSAKRAEYMKNGNKYLESMNKSTSKGTKEAAELLRKNNETKQSLDQKIEDRMGQMAEIATKLTKLQLHLIDTFGDGFTGAVENVISGLDKLAENLPGSKGKTGSKGSSNSSSLVSSNSRNTGSRAQKNAMGPGTLGNSIFGNNSQRSARYNNNEQSDNTDIKDVLGLIKWHGGISGDRAHFDQLDPELKKRFIAMLTEYGSPVTFTSGARSPEEQAQVKKNGGIMAAKPGQSLHQRGTALDLDRNDVEALKTSGLLKKHGLTGINNDPVHIQLADKGASLGANDVAIVGEKGPEIVQGSGSVTSRADTSELFNRMNNNLEAMLKVLKDQQATSEKILWAQS